jgi:tetratricopeptide (TPR) repeat protein
MNPADQLMHEATIARNQGKGGTAVALYQQAADLYDQANDPRAAAEAIHMKAVSYKSEGDLKHGTAAFSETARRYKELDDQLGLGRAERDFGGLYDNIKQPERALTWLQRSVETLQQSGALAELGISEAKLGLHYLEIGQLDEADGWINRGLTDIRREGNWFYETTALWHLAQLRSTQKNWSNAMSHLDAGLSLIEASGEADHYGRRLAQLYGLKAYCQLQLDETKEAVSNFKTALNYMKSMSAEATKIIYGDIKADHFLARLKRQAPEGYQKLMDNYNLTI